MATAYEFDVKLGLKDALSGGLGAVISRLAQADAAVLGLKNSVNGLGKAFAGLGTVLVGGAILKGMEDLVKHGAKLEHFKVQLDAAGYSAAQVGHSVALAWKEAGHNINTSAADNLKNIHHIANITGSMEEAHKLLPVFNMAETALASLKDEKLRAHFSAGEDQTYNLARALEQMGVVARRPGETAEDAEHRTMSYVNTLLRGMIAMRGKVDGNNLFSTVQNSGGTQLKWSEDFIGHELITGIQEFGQKFGNITYMMNAYLSQGRMTKAAAQALHDRKIIGEEDIGSLTKGASESEINARLKYGLVQKDGVRLDAQGRMQGLKPDALMYKKEFDENWVKWARERLLPLLQSQGIKTDDEINKFVDEAFRNKTVALGMRWALVEGSRTATLKENENINRVATDAVDILQKNDPSLAIKAFHVQWENLLTALGHPMVHNATGMLGSVAGALRDMSQFVSANPETAAIVGAVLAGLAAGLVAIGGALIGSVLLAALGPAGWLVAGLFALGGAVATLKALLPTGGEAWDFGGANLKPWYKDGRPWYEVMGFGKEPPAIEMTPRQINELDEWFRDGFGGPKRFKTTSQKTAEAGEAAIAKLEQEKALATVKAYIGEIGEEAGNVMPEAVKKKVTDGLMRSANAVDPIPMAKIIADKINSALSSIGGMISVPSLGGGVQQQSFAPSGGGGKAIQTTTTVNLDGRQIARQVAHHIARDASNVNSGAGFDGVRDRTPIDYSYA